MSNQTTMKTEKKESSGVLQPVTLKSLKVEVAQKKPATVGFSIWVRALLQGWRQGTVGCKGRADVSATTKKPWKQKGTGRARAGSARSPIWRGGGVTFGPQPRTKKLTITKGLKKHVFRSLLAEYANNGNIVSFNNDLVLENDIPKTSVAYNLLKSAGLNEKKVTLFLTMDDMLGYASFANIPNVRILFFDQVNAFDLAKSDCWVFFNKDLDHFKEIVSKWI